jgi:sugar lactone lactonase YvrE
MPELDIDKYTLDIPESFEKNVGPMPEVMEDSVALASISAPPCRLGETPLWCSLSNSLIFVDIMGKKVFQYYLETNKTNFMSFEKEVGFAIPTTDTTPETLMLFVGVEDRIMEVNFTEKKIVRRIVNVLTEGSLGRFNDAKCSPNGNLYAGFMKHNSLKTGDRGHLYRLDIKFSKEKTRYWLERLTSDDLPEPLLSNGMAWAKGIMYFIDTGAASIFALDVGDALVDHLEEHLEVDTGTYTKRATVFTLSTEETANGVYIDGMTIDAAGNLWVAFWGAGKIVRIDPRTGTRTFTLSVPANRVTCCTFGGENLEYLFITTMDEKEMMQKGTPASLVYVAHIPGVRGRMPNIPVRNSPVKEGGAFFQWKPTGISKLSKEDYFASLTEKPYWSAWSGPEATQPANDDGWWVKPNTEDDKIYKKKKLSGIMYVVNNVCKMFSDISPGKYMG